jgi:8-oxo-dGTP pyrophosphatase MutT (NUDIX family)
MDDDRAAWRMLEGRDMLRTPYYTVTLDRVVHPSGRELDYYVIRPHRQAVGVVPVDGQGRVLMVRQWRHTVQKLLWEIPAGAMEANESPAEAAHRELREETGYVARDIQPLYRYHPSIGTSSQTFNLFVAGGLERVGEPDAMEIHATRWTARAEIEQMLSAGEQVDGMTLTALLIWLRR